LLEVRQTLVSSNYLAGPELQVLRPIVIPDAVEVVNSLSAS
jgi:hypothetical protein